MSAFSYQQTGLPGARTARAAAHRRVLLSPQGKKCVPGLLTISGSACGDSGNTGNTRVLRAGTIMGRITSGGKWANSILGPAGNAYASGTTLSVTEATGDEIVRRIGSSGTFKLTGPPTAAGTVRTLTVSFSAVAAVSGGNRAVTITALPVADVWTLTAPAGQDAGMYQLEITTGKGTSAENTQVTAALAAGANSATVDAALEALTNVGASGVVAVYSDPTLTLTFAATLGPVHVRVLTDTTNDGGVFEGGWAAVHTTTGVDGRFVATSYIQPTDGSENMRLVVGDGWGIPCIDDTGTSQDQEWSPWAEPLYGGLIDTSQLCHISSDTALLAYTKAQLRANGGYGFDFDDDIT